MSDDRTYTHVMSNHEATAAQVTVARSLADSEDYYEMDACGLTYETCTHAGCIHLVLMDMAAKRAAGVAA